MTFRGSAAARRNAVNRITQRVCKRGFQEILRSGKLLAHFRSGRPRAVSPDRNSENASGNVRQPNSSRYDGWPRGTVTFSAGRRTAQIEFARDPEEQRTIRG